MTDAARKGWTAAAGLAPAALGLVVMAGWHAHRMAVVRLMPAFVPMQYDSAAGFLLCGAGLAALASGRGRAARALAASAGLLALWSLLRAWLGVGFGLEALLSDAFIREAIPASLRMEPLSAAAFILASGAILALAGPKGGAARFSALFAGALLAGFGAAVALCYAGGIASAFGWGSLSRVPPHSGAGFGVLGAGLSLRAWPRRKADSQDELWIAVAAGLAAAVAAVFLWTALKGEERVRIQWHSDAAASRIKERVEAGGQRLGPEALFGAIGAAREPPAFAVSVYLGRQALYASPGAAAPFSEDYARDVDIRLGREAGRVRLRPSAELLRAERSRLPDAVGAVGLILSALLGWAVHLAQKARRQARELAAASESKSRFMVNVSREFGDPLTSIVGFGEILSQGQDGPLNTEQDEDARAILAGGRRLKALVKQLSDLARLEAGKPAICLEPVSAAELLEDLRREFEPEAARRGLSLRIQGASEGEVVLGDRGRLRKALCLLLANAFKFTPEGEISLGFERAAEASVFVVKDTGVGLSREERRKLFEPFWQSPRSGALHKPAGLGLGLSMAKKLVEAQGGRLAAEGEAGAGSAFYVWLPQNPGMRRDDGHDHGG